MKESAILFFIFIFSLTGFAQKPKTDGKNLTDPAKNEPAAVKGDSEKEELEKASALTDVSQRIKALKKFAAAFPKSSEKIRAQELLVASYAQLGNEQLKNSEAAAGVKSFKTAIASVPETISDKLFGEILMKIPPGLFFGGQREAGIEAARTIESKIGGNAKQLVGLATFYLSVENGAEAARLANQAIASDANLAAAYRTAGLANRLNFQLEDSVKAYTKALELSPDSTASRRSLAEMKRAVGKSGEAVTLYKEILARDANDLQAQTGLILSLFDDGKQFQAETEMAKTPSQNDDNLLLLVGAAYWYAAHHDAAKTVDLAGKAVALEPRYVWAHIALARGYILQKRPLDAERELLAARQYGNFPTLTYELASARLQAGFYREAAEILKNDFTIKDDVLSVKLGGRVEKNSKTFIELLAPERRAGIFEPLAADSLENAERLKSLLDFSRKLNDLSADDAAVAQAADKFIDGDESMKLHRQLFAARQLLTTQRALPKAEEIAQATIGKSDAALDVPNAAAAVLADALYDSRQTAALKNEIIIVPEVPRPTLSAILRGEIEELIGWSAFQQNKTPDAVVHLKRAVSVLPENSSFWRSSMWRLGASLAADGKDKEALYAYLKSYPKDEPSFIKYGVIENLYKKINGGTDGLESKIGTKPAVEEVKTAEKTAQKNENSAPKPKTLPTPEIKVEEAAKTTEETKPNENFAAKNEPANNDLPKTQNESIVSNKTKFPANEDRPVNKIENNSEIKSETIQSPAVIKTDNKQKPTEQPLEKLSNKTLEKPDNTASEQSNQQPKPLFEPVIIQVSSTSSEESKQTPAETKNAEILRPRVFITDNTTANASANQCSVIVSQQNVSIISNGGSLGLIVGFENKADKGEIKAVSSSPDDVSVTLDENIGALSGRSLFIIKSISQNSGIYKIIFEAACGRKEVGVKVR